MSTPHRKVRRFLLACCLVAMVAGSAQAQPAPEGITVWTTAVPAPNCPTSSPSYGSVGYMQWNAPKGSVPPGMTLTGYAVEQQIGASAWTPLAKTDAKTLRFATQT